MEDVLLIVECILGICLFWYFVSYGIPLLLIFLTQFRKYFYKTRAEKAEDFFTELNNQQAEILLRTKLIEHARNNRDDKLLTMVMDFKTSYQELKRIANRKNL